MSWKKETVKTPIPDNVTVILSNTADAAGTLATLFQGITNLLQIVKTFFVNSASPFASLVTNIINELENVINDAFGTGFSILVINPFELTRSGELIRIAEERKRLNAEQDAAIAQSRLEQKSIEVKYFQSTKSEGVKLDQQLVSVRNNEDLKLSSLTNQRALLEQERADLGFDSFGIPILTPKAAIDYAVASFDDLGDLNRPIFSDSANISAIGFMITAPGLDEFMSIIENFNKVFSIPDFEIMLFRLNEISNTSAIASSLPDWKSAKLNSFTPMDELQKVLVGALETLKGFEITAGDSLDDLISVMQDRTDKLNKISNDLNNLINSLQTIGVYVLKVPLTTGGVNKVKTELRDVYLECSKNNYTTMALIVGGGADANRINNLLNLLVG